MSGNIFKRFFGLLDTNNNPVDPALKTGALHGLEISLGNVPGRSVSQVLGLSGGVDTFFKDVWCGSVLNTITYDTKTQPFTAGLILTGAVSSTTAIIVIDDTSGATGTLTIRKISGSGFTASELITDNNSGTPGSATTNALVSPLISRIDPSSAITLEVICESADDDLTGLGARSLFVSYLDGDYVAQTTTVNLGGHTAVTFSVSNFFRLISASVSDWGSGTDSLALKANRGIIIMRDTVTKDVQGLIYYEDNVANDAHGFNTSQQVHYTVPAGKTAFPIDIVVNSEKNNDIQFRSLIRAFNTDAFLTFGPISTYQNNLSVDFAAAPGGLPEKSDVKFIARSDNSGVTCALQINFILVDN